MTDSPLLRLGFEFRIYPAGTGRTMYVHCTNCTYNVRTLYVQCPLGNFVLIILKGDCKVKSTGKYHYKFVFGVEDTFRQNIVKTAGLSLV